MPMRPRSGRSRVVRHRKSCCSSVGLGCLKLKTWQPCGLTPGHHVLDRAVLARRIHRLEDQQHRIAVGRIQQLLRRAEARDMVGEKRVIIFLEP